MVFKSCKLAAVFESSIILLLIILTALHCRTLLEDFENIKENLESISLIFLHNYFIRK